jgi:hypothetical protein
LPSFSPFLCVVVVVVVVGSCLVLEKEKNNYAAVQISVDVREIQDVISRSRRVVPEKTNFSISSKRERERDHSLLFRLL